MSKPGTGTSLTIREAELVRGLTVAAEEAQVERDLARQERDAARARIAELEREVEHYRDISVPAGFRRGVYAGRREGAEAMREAAAQSVMCGCLNAGAVTNAKTKTERWRACGSDPCGAEEAAIIRALPLPPEARD